ncbi:hypothetical protein QFZ79_002919 [Arthrobacter sp. V4I6]|uniref:hypothetical protein n=1 Tax=Arthrobacter sp. V4I6 TaxID=3042281 RepID=UPI002780EF6C|nr:hypothetical protein [Arthrobacter sp. V4I6]MDQ0854808.1 hypothetical protein [Arthrobacter sp. V4I6]
MSRPEQATTGWPASCLTLGIGTYVEMAGRNETACVPVSGDAQARMDVSRHMNYIRGRMLKIQWTADDHQAGLV